MFNGVLVNFRGDLERSTVGEVSIDSCAHSTLVLHKLRPVESNVERRMKAMMERPATPPVTSPTEDVRQNLAWINEHEHIPAIAPPVHRRMEKMSVTHFKRRRWKPWLTKVWSSRRPWLSVGSESRIKIWVAG